MLFIKGAILSVLLLCLLFSCSLYKGDTKQKAEKDIFKDVVSYINQDDFVKENFNSENVDVCLSDEVIQPNIVYLDYDILKKKYSLTDDDIKSDKHRALVSAVEDSIMQSEQRFKKKYEIYKDNKRAKYVSPHESNFCLYCSEILENSLYCDVVPVTSVSSKECCQDYKSIRQTHVGAYLFELDDKNNIKNVYKNVYNVD